MATNLKSYIGTAVRAARDNKAWSQQRLADSVGLTVMGISNIERGLSFPRLVTLEAIAGALEVSLADLLPPDTEYRTATLDRLRREAHLREQLRRLSDRDLEMATQVVATMANKPA